jgi:hypothetical protein
MNAIKIMLTRQKVWGMAVFSFRSASEHICEMAVAPEFQNMVVMDMEELGEIVSDINEMWAELNERRAA